MYNIQVGTKETYLDFNKETQYLFITLIADCSVIVFIIPSLSVTAYGLIANLYNSFLISFSVGSTRILVLPTKSYFIKDKFNKFVSINIL